MKTKIFMLKIPTLMHEELKIAAAIKRLSMNDFVINKIEEAIQEVIKENIKDVAP